MMSWRELSRDSAKCGEYAAQSRFSGEHHPPGVQPRRSIACRTVGYVPYTIAHEPGGSGGGPFTISRYATNRHAIPWCRISAATGSISSPYTPASMSQVGEV